jgi:Holliday junction resolvase RusA-like endonuclease
MTTSEAPELAAFRVFVAGKPAPQGSKRHVGRGILVESSKAVKPWREDIRQAMLTAYGDQPKMPGPLAVTIRFVVDRPKGHYRTGRNAHLLRDAAPILPTGKPDVDKLARAVLDAIGSAHVWGDDAQVVDLHATKVYAAAGEKAGAWITVGPASLTRADMTISVYDQAGCAT